MSQPTAKNETKNLQVTFLILYNGTYVVHQNTDPALEIVEIVLLAIVFLISFCANMFLLVTITSSYTLRGDSFNILLANFCVIFLIETAINMSFALLYICMDTWQLGSVGCCISSFMVQLVTLEISFGLCIGGVESAISVRHPYDFQKLWTNKKQVVAITTFWAAGILLCLPLLMGSIKSEVFPSRYGCSFIGGDGFVYMLFVIIWCYGLMMLIGVCFLIYVAIQQYKEYRAQMRKHGPNHSEVFMPGGLWTEWINVKLVAWLILFYLLLELPFIVIHHDTGLKFQTITNSTMINDSSLRYETVFTWFRYLYSCVFAGFVFKIRKDIRYKFKALLHCCRPNVVRDHSAAPVIKHENKKKGNRKDSIPPISLSTPVLYISPEGLCLRQLAPATKSFLNYSPNDKLNKAPNFISYLCDVECSTAVAEDYTSSIEDNFSNSFREESLSNASRRSSKESEMSLMSLSEFGTESFKMGSQNIPLQDLDSRVLETAKPAPPVTQKKTVRFAETLTFFKAPTPVLETPTPEWVTNTPGATNVQTGIRSKHSRIPMRIQPTASISPWKVELSETYAVNSPLKQKVRKPNKRNFSKETETSNRKSYRGSPLHWIMND